MTCERAREGREEVEAEIDREYSVAASQLLSLLFFFGHFCVYWWSDKDDGFRPAISIPVFISAKQLPF